MARPYNVYGQRPFVHHAKVIWIYGNVVQTVLNDKPWGIARKFVKDNKCSPQFCRGKLQAISMLTKNPTIV